MARSRKHEKNLARVQSMLDGDYNNKIQVGAIPKNVHEGRKVGDKWVDSDGVEWEQKDGYRSKISKVNVGIFDKVCDDCEKACIKKFDKDTHNRMGRCYNCQVQFEENLKWDRKNRIGKNGNKWFFWVKLQQLRRWDAIDADMEQLVEENYQEMQKNPFDKSVANAMANQNLEMSLKQNKA